MNIERIAHLVQRLQMTQQHANVLVKDRHKLIGDIVRERRIQQLAVASPHVALRRHQTLTDKLFNVLVRIALVDARRRVQDDLDVRRIVDVDEYAVAQPQFRQIAVDEAVVSHRWHDFCIAAKDETDTHKNKCMSGNILYIFYSIVYRGGY